MLTEDSRVVTSIPSPSQSPSPSTGQISGASKLRGGSKWGRLLGSSSVDSASDSSAKVAVSRSLSARESLRESAQARSNNAPSSNNGGQGNKVRYDQKKVHLNDFFVLLRFFQNQSNFLLDPHLLLAKIRLKREAKVIVKIVKLENRRREARFNWNTNLNYLPNGSIATHF